MADKQPKRNLLKYAIFAVVVVAVLAVSVVSYFMLSSKTKTQQEYFRTYTNLSNTTFNRTKLIFLGDLEKSINLTRPYTHSAPSGIYVSYVSGNYLQLLEQPNNLTEAISSVVKVESYHLGNYNRTGYQDIVSYSNAATGSLISQNITGVDYYSANATITCFNQTSIDGTGTSNTNLQCINGISNQNYLLQSPFTAANVSYFGYLIIEGNLTYTGTKTIIGRKCDSFEYSNITQGNILSNYSVISLCLDSEYGIPLYINNTRIVEGTPEHISTFTATNLTTNLPNSDFVIPQQYLDRVQSLPS